MSCVSTPGGTVELSCAVGVAGARRRRVGAARPGPYCCWCGSVRRITARVRRLAAAAAPRLRVGGLALLRSDQLYRAATVSVARGRLAGGPRRRLHLSHLRPDDVPLDPVVGPCPGAFPGRDPDESRSRRARRHPEPVRGGTDLRGDTVRGGPGAFHHRSRSAEPHRSLGIHPDTRPDPPAS